MVQFRHKPFANWDLEIENENVRVNKIYAHGLEMFVNDYIILSLPKMYISGNL